MRADVTYKGAAVEVIGADLERGDFNNETRKESGVCPYCGAPYRIEFGGCRDNCRESKQVKRLVRECAEHPVSEQEESEVAS